MPCTMQRKIDRVWKCSLQCAPSSTAAVAQLVESRIVIPVVVGSSPISRPRSKPLQAIVCRGFSFAGCTPVLARSNFRIELKKLLAVPLQCFESFSDFFLLCGFLIHKSRHLSKPVRPREFVLIYCGHATFNAPSAFLPAHWRSDVIDPSVADFAKIPIDRGKVFAGCHATSLGNVC